MLDQIPDLKVIHFRFVDQGDNVDEEGKRQGSVAELPTKHRGFSHKIDKDVASGSAKAAVPTASQFYPKSLSSLDMLKLGKVVDERNAEMIQLYSFDLALMPWSVAPISVQFILEKDPVGTGGFRKAFRATMVSKDLDTAVWVVKEYLEDAAVAIARRNQTTEQHTKRLYKCICLHEILPKGLIMT